MNRRLLLSAGVAIAATVAGGYTLMGRKAPAPAAPADAGDPVAALMQLQLPDLSGASHTLSGWKGQPIVVNFWATWCAPCVREMPELDALQKKYPQVRFVGIGVDSAANMQKFVEKVQVSYPLWVIGAGAIDTLRKLGNPSGGLPFTIVFNADGGINRKILGEIQPDDLDRTLSGLKA
ncbi:TlpA family protein disulfide reductase [Achromobacter denitrificans]|jgi:thiol-disulfide isomerase/thioredoxin|uniref:TlpA family protein disulfide reductase n=1 Tax=Achromobacter denitrificans TaxID=32002 RepID=A0A6J5HFS5_ACHDE|nr:MULTISPECIES: TlpA disulfide reductase family protein [Achromobacter]ASC64127.1 thioredoxin [Achromobacter denitrificans]MBV2158361.1 TlpA family protein disulfide reductase [Achromobacter denitrificans]MDF3851559.1 TlpA disulfide reductase family protein [Achromobacter denitrificans]MDF3944554.1 TlpA disulfide reductase family protein [Achromobacter denitrificans]MDX3882646.1 TlpA disulfide reductase family protein [Achromobacter sp.]